MKRTSTRPDYTLWSETSRATVRSGEHYRGPLLGDKFWLFLFKMARSDIFHTYEQRLDPKRREPRSN